MRRITAPAPGSAPRREAWRQTLFEVSEARRALPYIANVARDATSAFHAVLEARQSLVLAVDGVQRQHLSEARDQALRRLDCAIDECDAVGADLVDLRTGVISFPATLGGRRVSLMWRVGEKVVNAWNDLATV